MKNEKIKNHVKWWASALFWPFAWPIRKNSLQKWFVFLTAWRLLQPASAVLFPKAETALKEVGISNPKVIEELAPGITVYVRRSDAVGTLHSTFDDSPWFAPFTAWDKWKNRELIGAQVRRLSFPFNKICVLDLREKTARNITSVIYGIAYSSEESYQQFLLGEIRRCSSENRQLKGDALQSGDADYRATEVLAREMRKPGLKQAFFSERAMTRDAPDPRNTSLYIDAVLRGLPIPSSQEIDKANAEAQKVNYTIDDAAIECLKQHKKCDLMHPSDKLSPLAQRRMNLFTQAWNKKLEKYACPTVRQSMNNPLLRDPLTHIQEGRITKSVWDAAIKDGVRICPMPLSTEAAALYLYKSNTVAWTPSSDTASSKKLLDFIFGTHELFHHWQSSQASISGSEIENKLTATAAAKVFFHLEMTAYVIQTRAVFERALDKTIDPSTKAYGYPVAPLMYNMIKFYNEPKTGTQEERLNMASVKLYDYLLTSKTMSNLRNHYQDKYKSDDFRKAFSSDSLNRKQATLNDLLTYTRLPNGLVLYRGKDVPTDAEFANGIYQPQRTAAASVIHKP